MLTGPNTTPNEFCRLFGPALVYPGPLSSIRACFRPFGPKTSPNGLKWNKKWRPEWAALLVNFVVYSGHVSPIRARSSKHTQNTIQKVVFVLSIRAKLSPIRAFAYSGGPNGPETEAMGRRLETTLAVTVTVRIWFLKTVLFGASE